MPDTPDLFDSYPPRSSTADDALPTPTEWEDVAAQARAAEADPNNYSLFDPPAPEVTAAPPTASVPGDPSEVMTPVDPPAAPAAVRSHEMGPAAVSPFFRDRTGPIAPYRPRRVNAARRYLPEAADELLPLLVAAPSWDALPANARAILDDVDVRPTSDGACDLDLAATRAGRAHGAWDARQLVDRYDAAALEAMIVALFRGRSELAALGPRATRYVDAALRAAAAASCELDPTRDALVRERVQSAVTTSTTAEACDVLVERAMTRLTTDPRFALGPAGAFSGDTTSLVTNLAYAAALERAGDRLRAAGVHGLAPAPRSAAARVSRTAPSRARR